jgi:hypothetical protein
VLSFTNRALSSGEGDSHFFLCASASLFKIGTLLSGERDSHCFLCAFPHEKGTHVVSCVYQHLCTIFGLYPQLKEIVNISVVQEHV